MKQAITFGMLLAVMPETVTDKNPTPKYLRENDIPILISQDGRAVAYQSGYVYYKSSIRDVVLNVHECWKFTYEMKKWICPVSRKEVLKMDWYTVIVLKGEEQAALNLENRENDHRYRLTGTETDMIEHIPDTYDLEETLINKLYAQELLRMLPEKSSIFLILHHGIEYNQEEIAGMFRISQQAVSKALKKARKQMKILYQEGDEWYETRTLRTGMP